MVWKYILIVFILAVVVGGGILAWQYFGMPEEERVGPQEEGKGVAEESKIIEEEFSIEEENLPSVDTSNWEIREHRYNYSFKYPGDTYKWKYLAGTCEDLQEINPQQKCKEVEYPDSAVRSDLLLAKKEEYKVPEWYPTESIYKDFFVYQAPIMSIGVYSNSAKLGLADLCEKYYEANCCSKEPNYTIGGVPAIRCTKKYTTLTKLEENLDWLSVESRKWLEEKGYKPGDFVKTDLVRIRDLVIVLFGEYRYQVVSNSYLQERNERAILESILSSLQFLE